MKRMRPPRSWRTSVLSAAALGALCAALPSGAAQAARAAVPAIVARDAGAWDLVFEKGNRRCRLFLRAEPHAAGYAIGLPAGCHTAFPTLARVTNWAPGEGETVDLRGDDGTVEIAFAANGTASLAATVGAADDYLLTPADETLQDAIRAGALPPPVATATAAAAGGVLVDRTTGKPLPGSIAALPAPALPPATAAEVAGNYAVFRQDRDTGCMVTLEAAPARGASRAKLAPGCADQGIVIFDPSGWSLVGGALELRAKRGHSTKLVRRDEKTWANAPAFGAALILKRL